MEKEFQKSNRSPLESVEYRVVLMQDYTAHSQGKHDGRATSWAISKWLMHKVRSYSIFDQAGMKILIDHLGHSGETGKGHTLQEELGFYSLWKYHAKCRQSKDF